jgi:hypothetical protein
MQEICDEHNRKIAEIDKRTKRHLRILFILSGVGLGAAICFRFFY